MLCSTTGSCFFFFPGNYTQNHYNFYERLYKYKFFFMTLYLGIRLLISEVDDYLTLLWNSEIVSSVVCTSSHFHWMCEGEDAQHPCQHLLVLQYYLIDSPAGSTVIRTLLYFPSTQWWWGFQAPLIPTVFVGCSFLKLWVCGAGEMVQHTGVSHSGPEFGFHHLPGTAVWYPLLSPQKSGMLKVHCVPADITLITQIHEIKTNHLKMWACFILAYLEGSLHIPKGRTLSDTYIANVSLILRLSFKKTVVACLTICGSTMTCLWGWEDNLQKWVLFFSLGGRGGGAWGLNAGHQASPQVGVLPAEPYH